MLISVLLRLIPVAFAQDPCGGISGCAAEQGLAQFITPLAALLVNAAAGLTVVFVVISGMQMVLAMGNDATLSRGKNGVVYALVGFVLVLVSQSLVSLIAARVIGVTPDNPHIQIMERVVVSVMLIFNALFAIVMIYCGFKLVLSRGQSSELDSVKQIATWAVIGAITVNLTYALVEATYNIFIV